VELENECFLDDQFAYCMPGRLIQMGFLAPEYSSVHTRERCVAKVQSSKLIVQRSSQVVHI